MSIDFCIYTDAPGVDLESLLEDGFSGAPRNEIAIYTFRARILELFPEEQTREGEFYWDCTPYFDRCHAELSCKPTEMIMQIIKIANSCGLSVYDPQSDEVHKPEEGIVVSLEPDKEKVEKFFSELEEFEVFNAKVDQELGRLVKPSKPLLLLPSQYQPVQENEDRLAHLEKMALDGNFAASKRFCHTVISYVDSLSVPTSHKTELLSKALRFAEDLKGRAYYGEEVDEIYRKARALGIDQLREHS